MIPAYPRLTLITILLSSQFMSCASIVGRSRYAVPLNSDPSEANVRVVNEIGQEVFNGKTPTMVQLESGKAYFDRQHYVATFTKDGHLQSTRNINAAIQPWYWGNFLLGGVIGFLIIDPLTGDMFKIDESPIMTYLQKSPILIPSPTPSPAIDQLITSSTITEQLRDLKKIYDEKLISASEYNAKKSELLARM